MKRVKENLWRVQGFKGQQRKNDTATSYAEAKALGEAWSLQGWDVWLYAPSIPLPKDFFNSKLKKRK